MPRPRRLGTASLAVVAAVLMLIPTVASAATQTDGPNPTQERRGLPDGRSEADMGIIGIDHDQAREAGNRIVVEDGFDVLIDGTTGEELARIPNTEGPTTQDTVYGDCGSSFIDIWDDPTPNWGQFETGFNLVGEAIDFDWYIHIYSHNGQENDYWEDHGPMFPSPGWASGTKGFETVAPNDLHDAYVVNGTAYLTDGRVCGAMAPYDYSILIT